MKIRHFFMIWSILCVYLHPQSTSKTICRFEDIAGKYILAAECWHRFVLSSLFLSLPSQYQEEMVSVVLHNPNSSSSILNLLKLHVKICTPLTFNVISVGKFKRVGLFPSTYLILILTVWTGAIKEEENFSEVHLSWCRPRSASWFNPWSAYWTGSCACQTKVFSGTEEEVYQFYATVEKSKEGG